MYIHKTFYAFQRLKKSSLRIDSFFCQGIAVGQTDYKIQFCYNERLANKMKNLQFGLSHRFLKRFCSQEVLGFTVWLMTNTWHIFSVCSRRCISQGHLFTLCLTVLKSIQTTQSNDFIFYL